MRNLTLTFGIEVLPLCFSLIYIELQHLTHPILTRLPPDYRAGLTSQDSLRWRSILLIHSGFKGKIHCENTQSGPQGSFTLPSITPNIHSESLSCWPVKGPNRSLKARTIQAAVQAPHYNAIFSTVAQHIRTPHKVSTWNGTFVVHVKSSQRFWKYLDRDQQSRIQSSADSFAKFTCWLLISYHNIIN